MREHRTIFERLETAFKLLLEGGVDLMFQTFIEFPLDVFKNSTIVGMLLGVGIVLMIIRDITFELLPGMIQYSAILAVWVTMTKTILTILLDEVIAAINVVESIVNAITGHQSSFMKFIGISVVNAASLKAGLKTVYSTCADGNPYAVMGSVIQQATHKPVCSFARYVYPIPWLYSLVSSFGSGLSLYKGSAVPDVSSNAPANANCNDMPVHVVVSVTCFAVNFGEFLVLVIVPLTLLLFYFYDCRSSFYKIFKGLLSLIYCGALIVDNVLKISVREVEALFTLIT
jgi:hypothetical protein